MSQKGVGGAHLGAEWVISDILNVMLWVGLDPRGAVYQMKQKG